MAERDGEKCPSLGRGGTVKQHKVINTHQPGGYGIFDQPRPSIRRELLATPSEASDPNAIQFVAHVVELSVEGGERPP